MKRREFLWQSTGLAGLLVPAVGKSGTPCPPDWFSVAGGTSASSNCSSADAQADWLARSTGPGVVWAHDFRSAAEVHNFTDLSYPEMGTTATWAGCQVQHDASDGITAGSVALTFPSNPPHVVRSITSIASNRARVVLNEPHDYSSSRPDLIQFKNIPGSSPWSALNETRNGGGGLCILWIVTRVVDQLTFEVDTATVLTRDFWNPLPDTSGFAPYSGSTSAAFEPQSTSTGSTTSVWCSSGRMAVGEWHRPLSAFRAGGNGLAADDIGITNKVSPARDWTPSEDRSLTYNRHFKDYYGHARYASVLDTWKGYGLAAQSGMYRGADFWIQFRQKLPLNRYQLGNAPLRNPDLKLMSPWTNAGTPSHEIQFSDLNLPRAVYAPNYPLNAGGLPKWYTNQNAPDVWQGADGHLQRLGTYDSSCVMVSPQTGTNYPSVNSCFHWPPDEWCAVMIHITMGYHYPNMNTIWPHATDASTATGVQMWVCPQSRIDAARNGGVSPTWITVWNTVGATGYPLAYSQGNADTVAPNYAAPGPSFNTWWIPTYQNAIPVLFGYTRKFTQIIFKQGNGGSDPYQHGIPCPRY
jgi:hypothetical protein